MNGEILEKPTLSMSWQLTEGVFLKWNLSGFRIYQAGQVMLTESVLILVKKSLHPCQ